MAAPQVYSPRGTGAKFVEDFRSETAYQSSEAMDPEGPNTAGATTPQRSGTLKKKDSVKQKGRPRTGSSVKSLKLGEPDSRNSLFYSPVPSHNNPTEILASRFQSWRKVLKDIIAYFREVQVQHEARVRSIGKLMSTLSTATRPNDFLTQGGILETNTVLADFHKEAIINARNALKIEVEVVNHLNGLRSDLSSKIKEIKALSGDFKSNVEKEKEASRKEVLKLNEALEAFETNPSGTKDPYIVKLGVDRQLRRHIAEENYLHKAHLNLESSGRELEMIIVGEIQKAYDTYVKISRREGQELIDLSERLTATTLHLPQDYEWSAFVERDPHMINPAISMRNVEEIEYPGHSHPAVTEVRAGILERKSKYLMSFTPAWYVLSPTYLHEFKSPDRHRDPTPVMSLYLPESSLGKHSDPSAVSHKFVLKARQTGSLHRGHSWVFRAETHAVMLEWYEAIKKLTEVSGAERDAYVMRTTSKCTPRHGALHTAEAIHDSDRIHNQAMAGEPHKAETYSDDNSLDNDEADEVPYSGQQSELEYPVQEEVRPPRRPEAGRFPSDFNIDRGVGRREHSTSGGSSTSVIAAVGSSHSDMPYRAYDEVNSKDYAYPQSTAIRDSAIRGQQDIKQNYVVPPVTHMRPDSPSSWASGEKYAVDETRPQNGSTAVAGPTHQSPNAAAHKSPTIPSATGFGIDPITGEHESPHEASPPCHIDFLGADHVPASVPVSDAGIDPREPIPASELGPVALESGAESLDAVANSHPLGDDLPPLSSAAGHQNAPVGSPANSSPTARRPLVLNHTPTRCGEERPGICRDNSNQTVGQETISDLPMPGKYPKKE